MRATETCNKLLGRPAAGLRHVAEAADVGACRIPDHIPFNDLIQALSLVDPTWVSMFAILVQTLPYCTSGSGSCP